MNSGKSYVKDLRVIKNRDISRVILIDNSPQTYLFQPTNAIPIVPFYTDETDVELLKLEFFLERLKDSKDVRPVLKDYFKLERYSKCRNVVQLVKELYWTDHVYNLIPNYCNITVT